MKELENELNELMLKLDYFEQQKKNITAMIEITGRKIAAFNQKHK